MKILFCQITGDDDPRPGIATFHLTFLVRLHSVGGDPSAAAPFPVGPRQCVQLAAELIDANAVNVSTNVATLLSTAVPVHRLSKVKLLIADSTELLMERIVRLQDEIFMKRDNLSRVVPVRIPVQKPLSDLLAGGPTTSARVNHPGTSACGL
jgi:hypothetical protein